LNQTASVELDRLLHARIDSANSALWMNLAIAALFAAFAFIAAAFVGRGISKSLKNLASTMAALARGRLESEVQGRNRGDEVGDMARAVQIFKDHEIERGRLVAAQPLQQKALAESEMRMRSLVKNIPGVAVRTLGDASRTVEFISDNILVIAGYSASDFNTSKDRALTSIIHGEDIAEYRRTLADSISRRLPFNSEYRILHKDGSPRFIQERGQAVFNDQGKVEFIDSHFVDRFADNSAPAAPMPAPAPAPVQNYAPAPAIAPAPAQAYTPAPAYVPAPAAPAHVPEPAAPVAALRALLERGQPVVVDNGANSGQAEAAAPAPAAEEPQAPASRPIFFGGNRS
jgi:PAS domain-containing protein